MNTRRVIKAFSFFVFLFLFPTSFLSAVEFNWIEEKSDHFIIMYSNADQGPWARTVLYRAEEYYDRIGNLIDYTRYQDYWTWDERTQIHVYPDREAFISETGLPGWSNAGAYRDQKVFTQRTIVTYMQEDGFLDGTLPHEISHLILRDFIGNGPSIPVWLDEGVAQLQEKDKVDKIDTTMKKIVRLGLHIPLKELMSINIRSEEDPSKVSMFYAESLSVVDFMIKKYGSYKFGRLCRALRNGKSLNEALKTAYSYSISSIEELEKKWLRYMKY